MSPGIFTDIVEFIGYSPFRINNITINQKHEVVDLKNIKLLKKQQTLKNVTVTTLRLGFR